jgi:uncharacterized protein YbjT (DUF2867 family)
MAAKIIAVVGATGSQGGGLVRAIQRDAGGDFTARALTRDVRSIKAKELAKLGAEMVAADVHNPESLKKAFRGAYGAFCVTFFWEHFSPDKEQAEAKAQADAAKAAGLQHVIWSTLEDTRHLVPLSDDRMPTLLGKYKVPHFDSKGGSDHYFTDLGLPVTELLTTFYWNNLYMFGMGPKKGPDGSFALTLPIGDKRLSGIGAEDIGKCAYTIFRKPGEFIGKRVGIAGQHLTGAQMAASLSKALGKDIRYSAISPAAYRGLGFPGAEDLGNMFQYFADFEQDFTKARDVAFTRSLNPELQTFDQWLVDHKRRIPLE